MAFDIFGNTLKPGHCEIHPNMNEEYPCSLCVSENNISNQQQSITDEVRELKHNLGVQDERITFLTSEIIKVTEQIAQAQEQLSSAKAEGIREAITKCGVVNFEAGFILSITCDADSLFKYAEQLEDKS